jgi:hypothetical protein
MQWALLLHQVIILYYNAFVISLYCFFFRTYNFISIANYVVFSVFSVVIGHLSGIVVLYSYKFNNIRLMYVVYLKADIIIIFLHTLVSFKL